MLVFMNSGKFLMMIDLELEKEMRLKKEGVKFFFDDDTHRPMAQFSSSCGVLRTIPVQKTWTPVGVGKYVKEVA